MKSLGLALGSGGSRGIAHIGFLQALEEAEIHPDFISGCSMGSVVGAAYAAGVSPQDMRRAACSLRFFDLFDVTRKPGGVLDTRKIQVVLHTLFFEFRACGRVQLCTFAAVAHIDFVYVVHQFQRLLFANIFKQRATEVVGDVVFPI